MYRKVVFYLPTPGGLTGAPRRLLTLASALLQHDFVVCIAGNANTELLAQAQELGFQTLPIEPVGVLKLRKGGLFGGGVIFRLRTGLALLRQNLSFRKLVRENGFDVVWMRGSKGIAFAALGAVLSRRPIVWDVDYELPSKGMVRWLHRFGLWASRAVVFQYQAAPDVIFGKELAYRYRRKFTAIIPGIDLFALEPYRSMREQRGKGIDDPFVILQVGTLCDRKNQLLLLEALGRVDHGTLSNRICVRLAGGLSDIEYVHCVERSIAEKGLSSVVEVLGWRDDVHLLMAEADLLVMPSKDEGVPNTVQEAMYIGLPLIVSNTGGMPEVLSNGQTGWVLPLEAPDDWAQRISKCVEDRNGCAGIARDAAAYAVEHFGTSEWCGRYAEVIRQESCIGQT